VSPACSIQSIEKSGLSVIHSSMQVAFPSGLHTAPTVVTRTGSAYASPVYPTVASAYTTLPRHGSIAVQPTYVPRQPLPQYRPTICPEATVVPRQPYVPVGGKIVGPNGYAETLPTLEAFRAREEEVMANAFQANARFQFTESTREQREARCMASTEAAEAARKFTPSAADEAFVLEKLSQRGKIVIFSKTACPFCSHAKTLISSLFPRPLVDIVELDGQPRHGPVQQALRRHTGTTEVPQALVNGQWVGNCQELDQQHQQGLLVPKLRLFGCGFA